MKDRTPIAVCSRSFSRHPVLRAEILERFEDVAFNDEGKSLDGDELAEFLRGRRKAITALEPIDDALLSKLPDLELISKVGVGLDMIDRDALERHGVELRFTPGTNRRSVAELVVAFAIALLRQLPQSSAELRGGEWRQIKGRCLTGRTVGIVGFGHVGRDVASLLRAFDCELLVHDVRDVPAAELAGARQVDLDELLRAAEVVTLHVELNDSTRGMLSRERLELMRDDAVLINTARGGLVDEEALEEELGEGRLAGAAFDVFSQEPPERGGLLELPNFLGTPHVAGSTEEAILAMGRAAIAALDGRDEEARDG